MPHPPEATTSAEDFLPMSDALLRFGAGADDGDAALLESAFTEDAVVDFGPCGRKLGLDFAPLLGRNAVVGFLAGGAAHQVTSHVVSNSRISIAEGRAVVRALVDATHIVRGERDRRFRMMNRYDAALRPHAGEWRIEHLSIDNVWFEGDPRTLLHR